MKKLLVIIIALLLIPMVSAVCTVTFDKTGYSPLETITAQMICSASTEKNKAYTLVWYNQSGVNQLENDTGTTPSVVDQNFFESFVIPSGLDDIIINASLIGNNLEGNDTANISAAGDNALIIENFNVTKNIMIGDLAAFNADLIDENGKFVSNARCIAEFYDEDNLPRSSSDEIVSFAGVITYSTIVGSEGFDEGQDFLVEVHCTCGNNMTGLGCWDEDGNEIFNSVGTASFSFTLGKWLDVNTLTDRPIYEMNQELFVCVNITNVNSSERVPMYIFHQVRCSKGSDNNFDLDKVLIVSDTDSPDERGISFNTTQMQCKRFKIPEAKYLQGSNSECYASTTTWVLNNKRELIKSYATTSPVFNISSNELNIDSDWQRIQPYKFNTIINLSSLEYRDYNGSGTGNIDVELTKKFRSIDPNSQFSSEDVSFFDLTSSKYIKNFTVTNISGHNKTAILEFLNDGSLEIEIRDADMSQAGWFNVTIEINDFTNREVQALETLNTSQSRSAIALEGIENRTGTFQLQVSCSPEGIIGGTLNCLVTAQVEDSQTVEKEVDFDCYILDDDVEKSSVNFNKMITRTVSKIGVDFVVPANFEDYKGYGLQCEAHYYNLGSRTDTFRTTFVARKETAGGQRASTGGASSVVVEVVNETITLFPPKEETEPLEIIQEFFEEVTKSLTTNPLVVILLSGFLVSLMVYEKEKKSLKKVSKKIDDEDDEFIKELKKEKKKNV